MDNNQTSSRQNTGNGVWQIVSRRSTRPKRLTKTIARIILTNDVAVAGRACRDRFFDTVADDSGIQLCRAARRRKLFHEAMRILPEMGDKYVGKTIC